MTYLERLLPGVASLTLPEIVRKKPTFMVHQVHPGTISIHQTDPNFEIFFYMWLWINTYENTIFSGLFTSIDTLPCKKTSGVARLLYVTIIFSYIFSIQTPGWFRLRQRYQWRTSASAIWNTCPTLLTVVRKPGWLMSLSNREGFDMV